MDEIETNNIELEHSVVKLLSENELLHKEIEHLKKIYKDQFNSTKKTRALSKEHCDSLIAQLNSKSMENVDLKGMFKLDLEPLSPKLLNNRKAHIHYLKRTKEQADNLHGIVKQAIAKQPLDSELDFACCLDYSLDPDSGCSKHMTGNRSQLINFVSKFLGKSKKHSHKPKAEDSIKEKLYLLQMDLYKPMRIESITGKKYILVILDDYSRFTWVKFQRSKDEVPEFVIKFLKMIQAEEVATACYTQNQSLIIKRHNKTPYELFHNKKPNLSYLHVFGALCYPTNDSKDLGKLQPKQILESSSVMLQQRKCSGSITE
nr:integrase, catalytic region, zinc finger, CCHC-type, peptidase aspartic, catalytic [Tanacetum cinerariifolium]